ncbi:hypothetical protein CEXT_536281 [Caerostris extrusa]|uniref:Uncharacterized protein n=1 Tax=Caerostris extrusa TaxID=172846 RepID=A0AAV4PK23_CAEEX|nr:hypothetical protein CEXT_536281 [Caerostris extrusa]
MIGSVSSFQNETFAAATSGELNSVKRENREVQKKRSIEMIGSVSSFQNETLLLLQVVETQFRQGTFHLKVSRKGDFLTEL